MTGRAADRAWDSCSQSVAAEIAAIRESGSITLPVELVDGPENRDSTPRAIG